MLFNKYVSVSEKNFGTYKFLSDGKFCKEQRTWNMWKSVRFR